ncbi:MAG: aminopeptidase P family protein [Planctomycetes bacterium]|nr:aminopeptidase P family protein [Planctomycetota bacterium]
MERRQFLRMSAGTSLATGLGLATVGLDSCAPESSEANPPNPMSTPPDPKREADLDAAADELFSHLSNQSTSVEPIQRHEYQARVARLAGLLKESPYDAMVAEGGATMRYLTGMTWGHSERLFALIITADGEQFWLCPHFEADRARLKIEANNGNGDLVGPGGQIVTWHENEYPFAPLAAAMGERNVDRIAVEPSLRHRFAHGFAEEMGAYRVGIGLDLLVELRGRKDVHELQLLRRVNELTQQGIAAAAEHIKPGMTGADISRLMRQAQSKLGLTGIWDLSLIGEASAYPHGGSAGHKLRSGEVLLVDTGGTLHGYQSDNTRSWVPDGAIPDKVNLVWNIVRDAQKAAFDAIRPGDQCHVVDRAARELIVAKGFGPGHEFFSHRLGHGIGTEGHEDPYFDGGSKVQMASGMTFSNEPGIYILGEFGIRIEDVVVVTDEGSDHFGEWQTSPRFPGPE